MKRERESEAPDATSSAPLVTLFVRCAAVHSRGELVNGLLYSLREALGITSWYNTAHQLRPEAPLEVVYVANSRRPYFLLEWRYQTPEELAKQHSKAKDDKTSRATSVSDEETHDEGQDTTTGIPPHIDVKDTMPCVNEAALAKCAQALLTLAKETLTYKDKEVTVSVAMPGVTVGQERRKLLERDALRKQQQQQQQQQQEEAKRQEGKRSTNAAQRSNAAATVTSFVPRTVRRAT